MGMQMHCQGNHAVMASVHFVTELRQGTNQMMIHSVEQLQETEVRT